MFKDNPHHRQPDIAAMRRARGEIVLSDTVKTILALSASHDGVSPSDLVARLVCQRATAIGLQALLEHDGAARQAGEAGQSP
jgi:hypothetical protein